jgi:hypothetical protein
MTNLEYRNSVARPDLMLSEFVLLNSDFRLRFSAACQGGGRL